MNRREWERRLLKGLKPLAGKERNEVLEYYREMYGDKIDAGYSEAEILAEFGSPEECARKILDENGISASDEGKKSEKQARTELGEKRRNTFKKHKKPILFTLLAIAVCSLLLCIPSFTNVKLIERSYAESAENAIESVAIDFSNASVNVYCDESVESLSVEYPQAQTLDGTDTSKITVRVENGSLHIEERPIWFYNICTIGVKNPKINVYLPSERTYSLDFEIDNGTVTFTGDMYNVKKLSVKTANGVIDTRNAQISCETQIELETDNGKIMLGSIAAHSLNASTDNGEISVSNGNVSGVVNLETDNGKISVNGTFVANEFHAETDNGEINASNGCIDAQTVTLDVDNGKITATIAGKQSDYAISVENDLGSSNVYPQTGGSRRLSVNTDIGEIRITFTE